MSVEDLTLRMRARGGRSTARDIDRVGDAVDRTGKKAKKTSLIVKVYTSALFTLQKRAAMLTIVLGLLSVTLLAVVPAVALLTAGMVALAGVLGPVAALGAGAMYLFAQGAGVAGSAASELTDVLAALKHSALVAIAPGAAVMMRGLSEAIVTLLPMIESLRPAFTELGGAVSRAMQTAATGLAGMGPEFERLIRAAGPMIEKMGSMVAPFTQALIDLAIAGMPVLSKMLDWLLAFVQWLGSAVEWSVKFFKSATWSNYLESGFHIVGTAARWVGSVFGDLGGIVGQLYTELGPITSLLGGALLFFLQLLADVLGVVNDNFEYLEPLVQPLTIAFIALKIQAMALALGLRLHALGALAVATAHFIALGPTGMLITAFWALNAALMANPVGVVIIAIIALVGAVYLAYKNFGWFRDAVNWVWNALKDAWGWIKSNWMTLGKILLAPFTPFLALIKLIVDKLDVVKDVAGTVLGVGQSIGNALLPGNPFGGGDDDDGPRKGKKARGGVIDRSGSYDVGERGKERVFLGAGDVVQPHGGFEPPPDPLKPPQPAEDPRELWVAATFVLPDGTVVAKQVVKAAKKKASTR